MGSVTGKKKRNEINMLHNVDRLLQVRVFVHSNSYALLQAHRNRLPVTDNASVPPAIAMPVRISRFFFISF